METDEVQKQAEKLVSANGASKSRECINNATCIIMVSGASIAAEYISSAGCMAGAGIISESINRAGMTTEGIKGVSRAEIATACIDGICCIDGAS